MPALILPCRAVPAGEPTGAVLVQTEAGGHPRVDLEGMRGRGRRELVADGWSRPPGAPTGIGTPVGLGDGSSERRPLPGRTPCAL